MRIQAVVCIVFLCCLSTSGATDTVQAFDAVTYPKGSGRLGDRLIDYIHAKWLSFCNGVPLLYHPFPYSEDLVLSREETHMAEIAPFIHPSQVFVCPYFPENKWDLQGGAWKDKYFRVDFTNQEFMHLLKRMIAPIQSLDCTRPPPDMISLALHIREGGGFDPASLTSFNPSKAPPLCFYSMCLQKVLEILGTRPIFCYAFTDAKNPAILVDYLKTTIPREAPITFEYRTANNSHDTNVLEDFFSFQNFDILIRPDSNFSIVPALLHPFAIVCSPLDFSIDETGQAHTESIETRVNELLLQELLRRLAN